MTFSGLNTLGFPYSGISQKYDNLNTYRFLPKSINYRKGYPSSNIPRRMITQGYSTGPIEFSMKLAIKMQRFIFNNIKDDFRFLIIPEDIIAYTGNEFKRFLCALEAYKKSPNPVLSISFLADGLTDLNFAKYLKKLRYKSFLESQGLRIFKGEEPEDYDITPAIRITDIGDIFNYSYWFFWKEEPEDDYKNGFIPVDRIDPDDEDQFKESLRFLLRKIKIDEIQEEEILLKNSSSKAQTVNSKEKTVWLQKQTKNYFSNETLIGERTVIFVSPANIRDSIKLTVPQSNSLKLLEYQLREIASKMKYSLYIRNLDIFERKLKRFSEKYSIFFDRDIKKEGITKPRRLIQLVFEVLKEKYPDLPAWKYCDIYNDYTLIMEDGKRLHTNRGHGLGMANAMTTIIQCVLFEVILQEFELENYTIEKNQIKAIFYNDDATIGFNNLNDFYSYVDTEDDVLKKFGIIRNLQKSHWGTNFVFCEIYSNPDFNKKISYKKAEIFSVFAAHNIVHAKMICRNLNPHIKYLDLDYYLGDIISFWGYEFYPSEWESPASLGGWINPSYKRVRLDLFNLTELSIDQSKALYANIKYSDIEFRFRKTKKNYLDPLYQIYGPNLDLNNQDKALDYMQDISVIRSKYQRYSNRDQIEELFDNLLMKRINEYEKHIQRPLGVIDAFNILYDKYQTLDFLPPLSLLEKGEKIQDCDKNNNSYFQPQNPILSYIKFFNEDKISSRIIPDPRFLVEFSPLDRGLTSEQRNQIHKILSLSRYNEYCPIGPVDLNSYSFSPKMYNHWHNPNAVMSAIAAFDSKFNHHEYFRNWRIHDENKYNLDENYLYLIHRKDYCNDLKLMVNKFGWSFTKKWLIPYKDNWPFLQKIISDFSEELYSELERKEIIHQITNEELEIQVEERINKINSYSIDEFWKWRADNMPHFTEPTWLYSVFSYINTRISVEQGSSYFKAYRDDPLDDHEVILQSQAVMVWKANNLSVDKTYKRFFFNLSKVEENLEDTENVGLDAFFSLEEG